MQFCDSCGAVFIIIPGEPASKANSRKLVHIGGKVRFVKSNKALRLQSTWDSLCPRLCHPIADEVTVYARLFYESRRPDLDESLILDFIQGRIIENDRQVREKHIFWGIDKEHPRSEVLILTNGLCDRSEACLLKELFP